MKISGPSIPTVTAGAQRTSTPPQAEALGSPAMALESKVLKPAAEALAALPDFDAARVAELREQLARGELPFDPVRLAGLIQKFHGSR